MTLVGLACSQPAIETVSPLLRRQRRCCHLSSPVTHPRQAIPRQIEARLRPYSHNTGSRPALNCSTPRSSASMCSFSIPNASFSPRGNDQPPAAAHPLSMYPATRSSAAISDRALISQANRNASIIEAHADVSCSVTPCSRASGAGLTAAGLRWRWVTARSFRPPGHVIAAGTLGSPDHPDRAGRVLLVIGGGVEQAMCRRRRPGAAVRWWAPRGRRQTLGTQAGGSLAMPGRPRPRLRYRPRRHGARLEQAR